MNWRTPMQEKHLPFNTKDSISTRLWLKHTRQVRRLSQEHIST